MAMLELVSRHPPFHSIDFQDGNPFHTATMETTVMSSMSPAEGEYMGPPLEKVRLFWIFLWLKLSNVTNLGVDSVHLLPHAIVSCTVT